MWVTRARFDLDARKLLVLPVFLPPSAPQDATPAAFLSWGSTLLHGLTQVPCLPPLGARRLSWGFPPLQRSRWRESTAGSSRLPLQSRRPGLFTQDLCRRFPHHRLRIRSQVFPTSQRFVPLPALPPFSDGWRSWGSSLQGFDPPSQPRRFVTAGMPS